MRTCYKQKTSHNAEQRPRQQTEGHSARNSKRLHEDIDHCVSCQQGCLQEEEFLPLQHTCDAWSKVHACAKPERDLLLVMHAK